MLSIETKIAICLLFSLLVFFVTALIIGIENKAKWFQKRKKYSFFNRRGIISEHLFFGYPKCKEGFLVTLAMGVVIYVGCSLVIYAL